MLGVIAAFADDIERSYATGRHTEGLPDAAKASSVLVCGMGGSAVAGDVVRQGLRGTLGVPADTCRSATLPAAVDDATLVVVSSYSGETAETLAAFREAIRRDAMIVAVTSGGTL